MEARRRTVLGHILGHLMDNSQYLVNNRNNVIKWLVLAGLTYRAGWLRRIFYFLDNVN
jgi:hypothetical protein